MEIQKANRLQSFKGSQVKENDIKNKKTPQEIKDGKKKLALALGGLAAIGIAAVAIIKGKKGAKATCTDIIDDKNKNKLANEIKDIVSGKKPPVKDVNASNINLENLNPSANSTKLADIKFNKGQPFLADGTKYTGTITDTLKNGDEVTLEYIDGVIQKSNRKGENFSELIKQYNYTDSKLSSIDIDRPKLMGYKANTITFTPNGSVKTDKYGNLIQEVLTNKNQKLAYNADVCIKKPDDRFRDIASVDKYYKNGKLIACEEVGNKHGVYDFNVSEDCNRKHLQVNGTKTHENITTELYNTDGSVKSRVDKRIYDNGAYDIIDGHKYNRYNPDGTLKDSIERVYRGSSEAPSDFSATGYRPGQRTNYYTEYYYDNSGNLTRKIDGFDEIEHERTSDTWF